MAYERIKPEHAGAKNGGGAWMTRADGKLTAKRKRRQMDRQATLAEPEDRKPEMAELPESWRAFPDGTPVPNWVGSPRRGAAGVSSTTVDTI